MATSTDPRMDLIVTLRTKHVLMAVSFTLIWLSVFFDSPLVSDKVNLPIAYSMYFVGALFFTLQFVNGKICAGKIPITDREKAFRFVKRIDQVSLFLFFTVLVLAKFSVSHLGGTEKDLLMQGASIVCVVVAALLFAATCVLGHFEIGFRRQLLEKGDWK